MRKFMVLGVMGCVLASQAMAQSVVVSCYRGPWEEVYWDRANSKFIESLIAVGYSQSTALAIAERVCRNPDLVNNPSAMTAEVQRLLRTTPRDG